MEPLFKDAEVFQLERPTKATPQQLEAYYKQVAEYIIKEGWSDDDFEDVLHDVKRISEHDSGYEIAKELEGFGSKASYDIDTQFIEYLDDFGWRKRDIVEENVKAWVKAHNPKPKYSEGQKLLVQKALCRHTIPAGKILFVNGFDEAQARYVLNAEKDGNGGTLLTYEKVEANCIEAE